MERSGLPGLTVIGGSSFLLFLFLIGVKVIVFRPTGTGADLVLYAGQRFQAKVMQEVMVGWSAGWIAIIQLSREFEGLGPPPFYRPAWR